VRTFCGIFNLSYHNKSQTNQRQTSECRSPFRLAPIPDRTRCRSILHSKTQIRLFRLHSSGRLVEHPLERTTSSADVSVPMDQSMARGRKQLWRQSLTSTISLPDADDDANIDGSDESDLTRHEPVSPVVVRRKSSEHSRSRSKLSSESSTSHEEDHISFPKVKIHRDRKLLKNPSEMSLNDSDSFADSLSSSDSTGNPEMKSSKSSDSVDSSPSSTRHSASAIPIRRVSRSVSYGPVPVPSSPTTPGRHAGFKLSSRTLKRTLKDVRERTVTFADILSGDSATSATLLILLPTFEGDFMKKWMQETFQIKALLERLGLRIIGVGPGSPSHARFFCSRTGCAFDIYVDPKGKLFRELGCVDVVTTAKSGLSPTDASPTVNYLGGWFHISGKYVLHQQIAAQVVSAKTIADFLSTNLSRSEPM
jgi:hypothetical protein